MIDYCIGYSDFTNCHYEILKAKIIVLLLVNVIIQLQLC